jgi:Sulfotransferase family
LRNRLEIRACLAEHPTILGEGIEKPIFLMGLPRSGTTFLQNLFDHDDRLRLLRTWETLRPCPPPAADPGSVAPRIAAASAFLNRWRDDVEGFDATHLIDVTGPDECALVLNIAFAEAGFQNYLKVPSYFDWLLDSGDLTQAYRFHRTVLQLLQHQASPRRWVLKFPNHMLAMAEIRAVHPDAVFIATHRDPVRALASLCALTEKYRSARYDHCDRHAQGREMLHFVSRHLDRFLGYRDGPGGDDGVIDVDYYRLVADPVAIVGAIYNRVGMEMSAPVQAELAGWTAANPKGKRGAHAYSLADYGLDFDAVNGAFEPYRRRFRIGLEVDGA